VACALRSPKEQDLLYAQGRTLPGKIITWAKGWQSYHQYGLAIDLVLLIDRNKDGTFEEASWKLTEDIDKDNVPDWTEMLNAFKNNGWECGADWANGKKEYPHVQKTFGINWKELNSRRLAR
jgi:peptidoglycan L-alanyl-D-glutamate endopeptidase CwlK